MGDIKYADQTEQWEEWWQGYYFGAFYIFPTEKVMKVVDKLRNEFDPKSASYCRSHISLSEPLVKTISAYDIDSLKRDLSLIEPFEIDFGPLRTHPPYPGVTFTIMPENKFELIRRTIHNNQLFEGVELKRSQITPHMTIAEFITMERTNEIFEQLNGVVESGKFICKEIFLAVPDNNFYFNPVLSIPLGAG